MRRPLIICLIAAPLLLSAQSFDVSSIRPAAVGAGHEGGNRSRIEHTPNSLSIWNADLATCVQWAYDMPQFRVLAAHTSPASYDIQAKAGTTVSVAALRQMLQDLLATRFKVVIHRETRAISVYELRVAKGGAKLAPAAGDASRPQVRSADSLPQVENDSFWFRNVSIPQFGRMFGQLHGIELPVVDRTGIDGSFDIELKSAPAAAREGDTGALLAIVQQQLGLKLVPAKAPFEVIVIDRSEKPSEN